MLCFLSSVVMKPHHIEKDVSSSWGAAKNPGCETHLRPATVNAVHKKDIHASGPRVPRGGMSQTSGTQGWGGHAASASARTERTCHSKGESACVPKKAISLMSAVKNILRNA